MAAKTMPRRNRKPNYSPETISSFVLVDDHDATVKALEVELDRLHVAGALASKLRQRGASVVTADQMATTQRSTSDAR